jgi:hypothetical protein
VLAPAETLRLIDEQRALEQADLAEMTGRLARVMEEEGGGTDPGRGMEAGRSHARAASLLPQRPPERPRDDGRRL